jgi:CHASE1-domain containing sensor protein
MKTNALTRIYTFVMSALFATVATVGVAVVMTSSGEHARMEFEAAAQQTSTLILAHNLARNKG